jgi:hypothetical protein
LNEALKQPPTLKNVGCFFDFFGSFHAFNEACLKTLGVTSRRLQDLAPLPTIKPESAGLCGYGVGYIVSLSLKNSDRVW